MKLMRTLVGVVTLAALLFGAGALRPLSPEPSAARDDSARTPDEQAGAALELLRRSRAEADPTLLPPARDLLRASLESRPQGNFAAALGMASLSNASHDFTTSVRWARRATRINPYAASGYGVLGDALFELGHVAAADRAYQKMIDLRPNVASYVRASYAAQFHRDVRAARHALRLAIEAAGPVGEEAAWVRHQLGDVFAGQKRYRRALRENRIGTELAPGYAPPAVGMAEALIGMGRFRAALPLMEEAVETLPALEYTVTLGDLYWELDDRAAARATWADAATKLAAYRDNGVLPDADFTLFYADHGVRSDAALREARAAFRNRPTAKIADALAWTLHAHGRDRAADRYARLALERSPSPDALHHFHAGMIASELGRTGRARAMLRTALDLDPTFSLFHRRTAAAELARLGGER